MLLISIAMAALSFGHAYHDHMGIMNGWSRCVGLPETEHGYVTVCVRNGDNTADIFLWKPEGDRPPTEERGRIRR